MSTHYIRSNVSFEINNDDENTNAEITEGSVQTVVRVAREWGILNEECVFMDGDCACNVLATHVAQVVGCKVFGIEYVALRCQFGTRNMIAALEDQKGVGPLVNTSIAYAPHSLTEVESFAPATVAYFFDEAFEDELMEHNIMKAAATPICKYVLSFKASKRITAHGFRHLKDKSIVVKKARSVESNTIYVYERQEERQAREVQEELLSSDCLYEKYLKPVWENERDRKAVVDHYLRLHEQRQRILPSRTRSHPSPRQRQVLLLGMIYAKLPSTESTFADIEDLVLRNVISDTMGRHTARCRAVEIHAHVQFKTVSKKSHQLVWKERHEKKNNVLIDENLNVSTPTSRGRMSKDA